MRIASLTLSILLASLTLSSCSTINNPFTSTSSDVESTGPRNSGANTIRNAESGMERALDKYDQEKMSHALDKPLGKSSDWANPKTGVSYTVTPTAKLTYGGNPYCRKYTIVSSKNGSQHQGSGTACVSASDSSWQIVN